jgi:alcohol dehydrogenase
MDIRGSNGWKRDDLDRLLQLTESGEFIPVIDSRVPLEDGVAAHKAIEERRFFGKIVITSDAIV